MPVYATLDNSLSDMKCSKCKRTKEGVFFITHGMLYKTCNDCRVHARRNSRAAIDERMAAAAANDDEDDDDPPERNAMMSMIALGFDNAPPSAPPLSSSAAAAEEDADTYAATSMRASMMEGRRLAILRRTRERMSGLSDRVISHQQVHVYDAFAGFNAQMNAAMLSSSSAAASSSNDSSGYFVDEPDPEPEPGP
jgi:hypothetical protein